MSGYDQEKLDRAAELAIHGATSSGFVLVPPHATALGNDCLAISLILPAGFVRCLGRFDLR